MKELIVEELKVKVDDDVFEWAKFLSLCLYRRKEKPYVITSTGKRLHRIIMKARSSRIVVDHINGNTLDNTRDNLRICSQGNNAKNREKSRNRLSSKYKGVHWCRGWMAQIRVNYKKVHLGTFKTEEEAALVYNQAAVKYFGEFARLNIIQ